MAWSLRTALHIFANGWKEKRIERDIDVTADAAVVQPQRPKITVYHKTSGRRVIVSSATLNTTATASNTTAPNQFVAVGDNKYAYRRFGSGPGAPLLLLQHFSGTLDNWDPAVTDPLALGRPVILFESAGMGRSSGKVPTTVAGMADHAMKFLDALGLTEVDVLGFSLGGMVAQVMALQRPVLFRRIILTGTGPEGGVGVAMDRPELLKIFADQKMPSSEKLRSFSDVTTEEEEVA
jgi:alpha-beta hydrolase superfamily lysophospholipase